MIRSVTPADAGAICEIYNYYIEHSVISFEYEKVSVDAMQKRIQSITSHYPWLVYESEGDIVAFAYANLWKARKAYQYTLESTIYAANTSLKKGVGSALYQQLFEMLDKERVHTLMSVIALPNEASVRFHEKMGFEKAGHFKQVGHKFGEWIDVGYWQKIL